MTFSTAQFARVVFGELFSAAAVLRDTSIKYECECECEYEYGN